MKNGHILAFDASAIALFSTRCTAPTVLSDASTDSGLFRDDHATVNDLATPDGTLLDVNPPDATEARDVGAPDSWPATLPPSGARAAKPGYRLARVIIHVHSVHSHDASDGQPCVVGGVNEPWVQSFRRAPCDDNIDVVFWIEHSSKMAEGVDRVMQIDAGDEETRRRGDEEPRDVGRLVG